MTETQVAEQILYSLLYNDAELNNLINGRIYPYIAPPKAVFPYVIYNLQAHAKDVSALGGIRVMSNLIYQVKVVGKDTIFEDIDSIASRIDDVLHQSQGSMDDGVVFAVVRESPISYPEVDNGIIYLHRGGLYRVYAQAS